MTMGTIDADELLKSVVISEEAIQSRVRELAEELSHDYEGKDVIFVGVLKGAFMFLSDLLKNLTIPVSIDFIAVSSYGAATSSSGVVRIVKDLDESIQGRHVVLVEDIVDTGLTLGYLLEILASREPASLEVCTLLDKEVPRKVDVRCKYVGFSIPNEFVVGYGLDYAGKFRQLPAIYAVDLSKIPG